MHAPFTLLSVLVIQFATRKLYSVPAVQCLLHIILAVSSDSAELIVLKQRNSQSSITPAYCRFLTFFVSMPVAAFKKLSTLLTSNFGRR